MHKHKKVIKKLDKMYTATINLPGSKSITIRNFILASLADGESLLRFPGICDDTFRIEDSLKKLGIQMIKEKDSIRIRGNNGEFIEQDVELDIGESGTSARLLMALSYLRKHKTKIDGHQSMRNRPNKYLLDALKEMGATVNSTNDGYLPALIKGPHQYANKVVIKGDKSSQYITGLLLIAPLLTKGLEIIVNGELVSKPYIDITIREMEKFGVKVKNVNYKRFIINPQKYTPTHLTVEGDASGASYFSALATLHGGTVVFNNLGTSTLQGDFGFFNICKKLGAEITENKDRIIITGPKDGNLARLDETINMESMPDVAPTLMAMAPFIPGVTRITGLSTLRIKECDRISAPVQELRKFGVNIIEGDDYVEIKGLSFKENDEVIQVETYNDHRMAMSLAVFGTKVGNVEILNSNCVAKSYPNFWDDLSKIYD